MSRLEGGVAVICVRNLTKQFGNFYAVNKVSFDVAAGEIFGFIGPNGAGKTTTIRMLATLLEPDDGTAWIDGLCIRTKQQEVRRKIGYMPDYFGVYEGVTVWEYLDFFARAYRIPVKSRNRIIEDCMALTDFSKLREKLVASLSKGMAQRLCLAKTLLHDPKVLILDEPTSGLDPRARIEFRSLIKELSNMGKTIFISSHILTELSECVTSIGIIEKGEMVVSGSPQEIARKMSSSATLRIMIGIHQGRRLAEAAQILKDLPKVQHVQEKQLGLEIEYQGQAEEVYLVLKPLVMADIPVVSVEQSTQNLENIFMNLTKGGLEE